MQPRRALRGVLLALALALAWAAPASAQSDRGGIPGPGDDREGYERSDYVSRSRDLTAESGRPARLFRFVEQAPLGLPPVPVPTDNPVTEAKIALGRKLFFDRRLSGNGTMSCAMCHVPEHGFTHNEMKTAVGIEGRTVRRNAPTIYNTAYLTRLFHDGREYALETQIWSPLLAGNEMGNRSVGELIRKISALPDYDGLFEQSFDRGPGMETIGQALASYERTLVSGESAFDRWYYGQQRDALSESARRGFALFTGRGRCVMCHTIGADSALFTDNAFHNTGVGYEATLKRPDATTTLPVAPGQQLTVNTAGFRSIGGLPPGDLGLYEVTGAPEDRWKYRTPSLRNVALTSPYMHDGSLATLEEVIRFYERGGIANELLDPLLEPLELSEQEAEDLVRFLRSLTGSNVNELVDDARAAPVGGVD